MRLLLDTHALIWFAANDSRFGKQARQKMQSLDVELYLSVASVWEMAIKANLGRLNLVLPLGAYVQEKIDAGLHILPIEWHHSSAVVNMPLHHKDPFDRLIIAQALIENMPVVSGDPIFKSYGLKIVW